jgi:hypothetical protein
MPPNRDGHVPGFPVTEVARAVTDNDNEVQCETTPFDCGFFRPDMTGLIRTLRTSRPATSSWVRAGRERGTAIEALRSTAIFSAAPTQTTQRAGESGKEVGHGLRVQEHRIVGRRFARLVMSPNTPGWLPCSPTPTLLCPPVGVADPPTYGWSADASPKRATYLPRPSPIRGRQHQVGALVPDHRLTHGGSILLALGDIAMIT